MWLARCYLLKRMAQFAVLVTLLLTKKFIIPESFLFLKYLKILLHENTFLFIPSKIYLLVISVVLLLIKTLLDFNGESYHLFFILFDIFIDCVIQANNSSLGFLGTSTTSTSESSPIQNLLMFCNLFSWKRKNKLNIRIFAIKC
jgi:hypothetical protein